MIRLSILHGRQYVAPGANAKSLTIRQFSKLSTAASWTISMKQLEEAHLAQPEQ